MSDLFISYSRKDKAFVQDLVRAVVAHSDRTRDDIWVDWQDIPPTADWWLEIQRGIEGAHSFVFVISPDSIQSEVCRREIEYARQHNKRFIPILCREIDLAAGADQIHEAIRTHNWILFTDTPFDDAVHTLIEALDTDIVYVRMHTRLMVRAREWETREHDPSFLLIGSEIEEAEAWLQQAMDNTLKPTGLHLEYITTSRRSATARQRRILTGITVALVVAVSLAVISFVFFQDARYQAQLAQTQEQRAIEQRNRANQNEATAVAERNRANQNEATAVAERDRANQNEATAMAERNRANEQAEIALSRQLAAQSTIFLDTNPDLSMLLAFEGLMVDENPQTLDALMRALNTAPAIERYLRGFSGSVSAVARSATGARLAIADEEGSIRIIDTQTGQQIGTAFAADLLVVAMHFGADDALFVGTGESALRVWDPASGAIVREPRPVSLDLEDPDFQFTGIGRFTPDGRYYVTGGLDSARVTVWDTETGQRLHERTISARSSLEDSVTALSITPNGRFVTFASGETLYLWDTAENRLTSLEEGFPFLPHAISESGDRLVWATYDDVEVYLHVYSLGAMETEYTLTMPASTLSTVTTVAFLGDELVALGDSSGAVGVFEVETGTPRLPMTRAHQSDVIAIAPTNGTRFASGGADGVVVLWDFARTDRLARPIPITDQSGDPAAFIDAADLHPEGEHLLVAADGDILYTPWRGGEALWRIPDAYEEWMSELRISPDEAYAAAVLDGELILWQIEDGEPRTVNRVAGEQLLALDFSPDGRYLVTGGSDNLISVRDVQSGELRQQTSIVLGDTRLEQMADTRIIAALAFSPDGSTLALTRGGNQAYLYDFRPDGTLSEDPTRVLTPPASTDEGFIWELSFARDGQSLAADFYDGSVVLWDLNSGQAVNRPFFSPIGLLEALAISPDRSLLAAGSTGGSIQLWDAQTGTTLGTPFRIDESGSVLHLRFTPQGDHLISATYTGVHARPMTPAAWRDIICATTNHNLAPADWERFFLDRPYHLTCPQAKLAAADEMALAGDLAGAREALELAAAGAVEIDDPALSGALCRYGALTTLAEAVLPACEQAVARDPENASHHISHALAQALSGDYTAAAWSLEQALNLPPAQGMVVERSELEEWLSVLRAGENPFGLDVRQRLRAGDGQPPYLLTRRADVPLLPDESPPDEAQAPALTYEEVADAVAALGLPFEPVFDVSVQQTVPELAFTLVSTITREELGDAADILTAGDPAFVFRLEDRTGQRVITVLQSEGPYASADEWIANTSDLALMRLGARVETDTIGDTEIIHLNLEDSWYSFAVVDSISIVAGYDMAEAASIRRLMQALAALRESP